VVLEENGEENRSEVVTNVEVLERIGEKRTLLNNILQKSQLDWLYSEKKLPSS
jgi:hypothetical protein